MSQEKDYKNGEDNSLEEGKFPWKGVIGCVIVLIALVVIFYFIILFTQKTMM